MYYLEKVAIWHIEFKVVFVNNNKTLVKFLDCRHFTICYSNTPED